MRQREERQTNFRSTGGSIASRRPSGEQASGTSTLERKEEEEGEEDEVVLDGDEEEEDGRDELANAWEQTNQDSVTGDGFPLSSPPSSSSSSSSSSSGNEEKEEKESSSLSAKEDAIKYARCKYCGGRVERTVEAIESHSETCKDTIEALARRGETVPSQGDGHREEKDRSTEGGRNQGSSDSSSSSSPSGGSQQRESSSLFVLGGVERKRELEQRFGTRIIYRTSNPPSKLFKPREMCTFQDCFIHTDEVRQSMPTAEGNNNSDNNGTASVNTGEETEGDEANKVYFVYETSVRHSEVMGTDGFVTCEVLSLVYMARCLPGRPDISYVTMISQIDAKAMRPTRCTSCTKPRSATQR
jgi:hypothetical protein